MKKTYSKPLISVEELSLDQPIAGGCSANKNVMNALLSDGWFNSSRAECEMWIGIGNDPTKGGLIDANCDHIPDGNQTHNTVCYHSNITTAFIS